MLCLMSLLVWRHLTFSLYGVALITAVLLFIGIHNAWDVALSISAQRQKEAATEKAKGK